MADYEEIVLDGHGAWNLKENPAWAQVPRGTTIKFLTENFRLMMLSTASNEQQALDQLQQFRDASPNQEGAAYAHVPNYTLSALGAPPGVPDWVLRVNQDTPLCDNDGSDPTVVCDSGIHRCTGLFADERVIGATLYWAACRYVDMAEEGSPEYYAETGVNQRQPIMGEDGAQDYTLSNSAADLWLDTIDSFNSEDEVEAWLEQVSSQLTEEQMQMVQMRLRERFPAWDAAHP